MTTTVTVLRAARIEIGSAHGCVDTASVIAAGRANKVALLQKLREARTALQAASNNIVAAEKGSGGDIASAVLTLAAGRDKVAQDLACDFGVAVTEDDDGSSTLYEFQDGSRLRIRLSAHVVERAETW